MLALLELLKQLLIPRMGREGLRRELRYKFNIRSARSCVVVVQTFPTMGNRIRPPGLRISWRASPRGASGLAGRTDQDRVLRPEAETSRLDRGDFRGQRAGMVHGHRTARREQQAGLGGGYSDGLCCRHARASDRRPCMQ